MPDDLERADLTAASDPVLTEWLEGDSCGPRVKTLEMRAVHTSGRHQDHRQHDHPDE